MSQVAVVALVVIFQPELRKIIAPAGVHPVDRRWPDVEVKVKVRVKTDS